MKRYAELALLREKLDIILFLNQYFYVHGCSNEELEMVFYTIQDELMELSKIYEDTKDLLEECI